VRCRTDPTERPIDIRRSPDVHRLAALAPAKHPKSPMTTMTRSARITGPVPYQAANGTRHHIPLGPCLLERLDDRLIDIIWGASGQRSTALPVAEVEAAQGTGSLILLD